MTFQEKLLILATIVLFANLVVSTIGFAVAILVVRNYVKIQKDTREALHELCNVLVLFQGYVNLAKLSEQLMAKTAQRMDATANEMKETVAKAG